MEESKQRVESALTDKQEKALIEIEKCHGLGMDHCDAIIMMLSVCIGK